MQTELRTMPGCLGAVRYHFQVPIEAVRWPAQHSYALRADRLTLHRTVGVCEQGQLPGDRLLRAARHPPDPHLPKTGCGRANKHQGTRHDEVRCNVAPFDGARCDGAEGALHKIAHLNRQCSQIAGCLVPQRKGLLILISRPCKRSRGSRQNDRLHNAPNLCLKYEKER